VFTAKLNAEGRNLAYVLRFGGSAGSEPGDGQSGGEFGTGIAVDKTGSAFVVGQTDSTDFPISEDAQPRFDKGPDHESIQPHRALRKKIDTGAVTPLIHTLRFTGYTIRAAA